MADLPKRAELTVVTFGCRLNAHESEAIRAQAAADGLLDAVVVNTCAVTGEAVRQARQAIRRAGRERPEARLVVTGCAAQIDPEGFARMDEVDLVLGNALKTRPGSYGAGAFEGRLAAPDIFSQGVGLSPGVAPPPGRVRAMVEIQNGCDHRCTFCVIPFGRGSSRSKAPEAIVSEVRALHERGVKEVVLTGVDLTSYAAPDASLGILVRRILKEVPELGRLRLSSIDAAELDGPLLEAIGEEERLAPHLHLSLQSGSDMILKRMKRRHSRADALRLIEEVRRRRPETAFGADLIAGFPTETETMFADTLTLIEDAGLSFVHVFPFSPRPGTPAARMPKVASETVKRRAADLRAAGAQALERHLTRRLGQVVAGLVEAEGRGRAADYTEIAFAGAAVAGETRAFEITGAVAGRARGRLIDLAARTASPHAFDRRKDVAPSG